LFECSLQTIAPIGILSCSNSHTFQRESRKRPACQRVQVANWRVTKIGAAFSCDRQDRMRQPRTKIARRPNLIFGATGPGYTGLYTGAAGVVATIAEASASPSSLDFGLMNVNSPSASMTATLTNNMSGPLTISSVLVTGTNANDFTLNTAAPGSCSVGPSTLASGYSCTVTVTFTYAGCDRQENREDRGHR
jgi:hypothetical protein